MAAARTRSDGVRLTKVGLWFLAFVGVVLVAAINTGNNGLYLVLAMMLAVVLASQLLAGWNVRGLAVELEPPGEIFANRPARLSVGLVNRSRLVPRWLLLLAVEAEPPATARERKSRSPRRSTSLLAARVEPRATVRGEIELLLHRRGRRRLPHAHVTSLFPFGLFRKGARYPLDLEVVVYPEIFAASPALPEQSGRSGEEPRRQVGWSHDLLALRPFRIGDDPRGIHWKHTARTGDLIYKVRQAEESRRLAVVLDNAVGELAAEGRRQRFERLVSEAASAAVDYLERGYEVELVTRDRVVPFAAGGMQRRRLLEHLAVVEPVAVRPDALEPADPRSPYLLLAMDPRREAA